MSSSKKTAIVILGGMMKRKPNGGWKTDALNYSRVLAGYSLYKKSLEKRKNVSLIVSGGKGIYKDTKGALPVATVMKSELISLGLKPEEVMEEKKSPSTYRQLLWLASIRKKYKKIILITNSYHIPRIRAMLRILTELKYLKSYLNIKSAEKVTGRNHMSGKRIVEIILAEKKGIKNLRNGNYKFR